jgi:hypothetical protein
MSSQPVWLYGELLRHLDYRPRAACTETTDGVLRREGSGGNRFRSKVTRVERQLFPAISGHSISKANISHSGRERARTLALGWIQTEDNDSFEPA